MWSPTETIEISLILFPVFELTVASRQRMAVKTWKNVGQFQSNKPRSEWKKQMFVLGDLMEKEWDLGDI